MYSLYLNLLLRSMIGSFQSQTNCIVALSQGNDLNMGSDFPVVNINLNQTTENLQNVFINTFIFRCEIFIFAIDQPLPAIRALESAIKISDQRFGERKIIAVPPEKDPIGWSRQILTDPIFAFIPNSLVVEVIEIPKVQQDKFKIDEEINFEIFTHKFIGKTNHFDLIQVDVWFGKNQTFRFNNPMFPDKMKNLQGKPVKIATFTYLPYTYFENGFVDGFETKLIVEYVRLINASLELIVDDINEWGEIYDNRTGIGILGTLVQDEADVSFAALYTWFHEYKFLDLTISTSRTAITCLTPAPRPLQSWFTPITPFSSLVWLFLILVEISAVLAFYYISNASVAIERNSDRFGIIFKSELYEKSIFYQRTKDLRKYSRSESTIVTLGMLLLQPFPNSMNSITVSLKHLLIWLEILTLIITSSYSGVLATNMTVPIYESSIKFVDELVKSDIHWGATSTAWIFSLYDINETNAITLVDKFEALNEEKLYQKSKTHNFAFSVERLTGGYFAIGNYVTEETLPYLQLMKEDIYKEFCVFMLRKSSAHTEGLNRLIGQVHAAGLFYIWEGQVVRSHMNSKVQLGIKISSFGHTDGSGPIKLRTSHLKGTYVIWIIGNSIAILAFFIEIILHQKLNI